MTIKFPSNKHFKDEKKKSIWQLVVCILIYAVIVNILFYLCRSVYQAGYRAGTSNRSISPYAEFAILYAIVGSFYFAKEGFRTGKLVSTMLSLFINMQALILYFGLLYSQYGLLDLENNVSFNANDGLYFSIVTWTTLGYGDFRPVPNIRLLAGFEALLGYVYMGVFISLLIRYFIKDSKNQ